MSSLPPVTESTTTDLTEVGSAVGIFFAFLMLAFIWKKLFFFIIRCSCCKIQRWKSLKKLEHILDLHDHIEHNTLSNLPPTFNESGGAVREGFLNSGVPLDLYATERVYPSGVNLEVETMARPINLAADMRSYSGVNTTPQLVQEEYVKMKNKKFFNFWPWDKEFYYSSDADSKKKKGLMKILRVTRDLIRCKCFCWWKNKNSGNSSSSATSWKQDSHRLIDLPLGYSFKGGHWIPRTVEGRSMSKYLRGNFLNLLASIGSTVLILAGIRLALKYADISLTATLTTASGIALISFFKIADIFAPILDHYSLLFSDYVERGDLVEITSALGGLNNTGYSLTGCVMDIGVFYVTLLCTKPYKTLSNIVGNDRFLNSAGQLVPATVFQAAATTTTPSTTAATVTTAANFLPQQANVKHSAAIYMERDFVKTKLVVRVSIHEFANAIIARQVSWIPVVNLQQINRF